MLQFLSYYRRQRASVLTVYSRKRCRATLGGHYKHERALVKPCSGDGRSSSSSGKVYTC